MSFLRTTAALLIGHWSLGIGHSAEPAPNAGSAVAPNLLVVQCDDLGWDDLGLHGNPHVRTPRLDALGRESVRFSQFTVNPVCAPSRATLLTGRHFLRTGVSHVHGGKDYLHLDERTLADHLRAAGYSTGMWGKWHLGDAPGYQPWQRGFDEAYTAQLYRHRATRGLLNGAPTESDAWADASLADQTIDFITRHRHRPWFAYFATLTPHGPLDAPDEFVRPLLDAGLSPGLAKLWGMVGHLDHQVGRVLDSLDRLGLADNTVVVFLSDNGPAYEGRELTDTDRALRKLAGLRGWKGDLHENGVRSPLFIRWPSRLAPREIDTPLDHVDLTPTFLDLARAAPFPASLPFDGRSFAGLLLDHSSPDGFGPYPILNYSHRGWLTTGPAYSLDGLRGEYAPVASPASLPFSAQSLSIREGPLKLIVNATHPDAVSPGAPVVTLHDLAADPHESTDLAATRPADRDRLLAALRAWWTDVTTAPHAFQPPVFPVSADTPTTLPARAPAALHGSVFNTVTELKNWRAPGDAARWRIRLAAPATLRITLRWRSTPPPELRFTLSGSGSAAATDGITPAVLSFPAGDSLLELRLDSAAPEAVDFSLRQLVLEPLPRG